MLRTLPFVPTIALALLSLPPTALGETLRVDLHRTRRVAPRPGTTTGTAAPEQPGSRDSELTAVLAQDRLAVQEGDERRVYDLASGRLVTEDSKAGTYADVPLEALVLALETEGRNRLFLRDVMRKAEVEQATNLFDLRATELELAIRIPEAGPAEVTAREEEGTTAFLVDGRVAATLSAPFAPVPESVRRSYLAFLVYEAGIHPAVAERLPALGIPSAVELRTPMPLADATTLLKVTRCELSTDVPARAPALARSYAAPPEVAGVLARSARMAMAGACPSREQQLGEVGELRAAGRWVEAYLALLEPMLSDGTPPTEQIQRLVAEAPETSGLREYLACQQAKDAAEELACQERSLAAAGGHAHLCRIFMANRQAQLGHKAEAQALFVEALTINPCVAGAWKDLGATLFDPYDSTDAWECWDVAAALAPAHVLLEPVRQLSRGLRERHPERF